MNIPFIKMHTLGNDYILLDCRGNKSITARLITADFISPASERRFGVGSDGVIIMESSDSYDISIRAFMPDGREEKANIGAVICASGFLFMQGECTLAKVETRHGIKISTLLDKSFDNTSCEVLAGKADKKIRTVKYAGITEQIHRLSLGEDYAVIFTDDLQNADIFTVGERIAKKENCDTVLAKQLSHGHARMRFFKSGQGEVYSCAAGACCGVAAGVMAGLLRNSTYISVEMCGGTLHVKCDDDYSVSVIGECEKVYDGIYEWNIDNI